MCEDCGCGDPKLVSVEVHSSLLAANDHEAAHLRAHFLGDGVTAINLMGSPGSGKTALLEATARAWAGKFKLAAVSGDLATAHDAERLERAGIPSAAITTGTACHLDASMVDRAIHGTAVGEAVHAADFFFIENVGNLVCPAIYDLGQAANVVALSVTEGVDKPLKYPVMFKAADLVVLTKVDLLPHLRGVSIAAIEDALARVMPKPVMIQVASTEDQGLDAWLAWLSARRDAVRAAPRLGAHEHVHVRGHAHPHPHPHR
ncbi:MAG: hydrogenase nickel incorporation protein HypB [Myxococcales bacterium]|nr:hydrogenase nickel incorporation protein HypB [Myxococcales bacterium]